jgi:hypothetical protein
MQPLRRVGEQVSMLVHRTALRRHVAPDGRKRGLQAGSAIDDQEISNPQQSWGFDGEPPKAVIKDSGTKDETS